MAETAAVDGLTMRLGVDVDQYSLSSDPRIVVECNDEAGNEKNKKFSIKK